jgi:adenine-specific DNA-methyltransferase
VPFLQFKGKAAVETYHHTVPHHTFEFDPKLSVLSAGEAPGLDGNLIIEGDNLLALKALLPTHAGRIKCIYIDPPYNTGNEGWVYNDNLTQPQFKEWIGQTVGKDEEDACRHDKWCCMMYPRLMLLKELLRDDGAIFVSIDDNEVQHLRAIMDEVFGEENFVATVIWEKVYSPKSTARYFSENHDFIVVYARAKPFWELGLLPRTAAQDGRYSNPDNDPRGVWKPGDLSARNPYSRGVYSIRCPAGREIAGPPPGNYWRYSEDKLRAMDADGRIWWGEDRNQVPAVKRFLTEVKKGLVPETIWTYQEVGHTQDAKKTLLDIFSADYPDFLTPKPVPLIQRIAHLCTEDDDLVLDSFAGSGTTAHAVQELNRQDGGDRKFILVQMPYDTKGSEAEGFNICERITAERVRRVMAGYAFTGRQTEVLLEEKVTLTALKKAGELLARIEAAKQANAGLFDEVTSECKDGVVRVLGVKEVKGKTEGLGGSFTYARLSPQPLFGEYRSLGEALPAYEEIAKYVFYTETSRQWSPAGMNQKTGFIGAHAGRSFYLLYRPNAKADWALDTEFLRETAAQDENREIVVYCEKIWVHRSDRGEWEAQHGKRLRPMLVPFNLK